MESRIKLFDKITHDLLYLDDKEILDLTTVKSNEIKWGETGIIKLNRNKIFFKKIPIAKLFYSSQFDTSNLYDLPTYYNYGFGSAGINPWRELDTHINVTKWVLTGECKHFPLLYHYRIVKDNEKNFNKGDSPKLMERYGNDKNILKYLNDRFNCEYKIICFLEFIPYVLYNYIKKYRDYFPKVISQINLILDFLESKGILHTDAHWGNYLVDSKSQVYITDFGLLLDKNFKLDSREKKFFKLNIELPRYYLAAEVYDNFVYTIKLKSKLKKFINELSESNDSQDLIEVIIESASSINELLRLPKSYIDYMKRYKNKIIAKKMLKVNLVNKKNKNTVYL